MVFYTDIASAKKAYRDLCASGKNDLKIQVMYNHEHIEELPSIYESQNSSGSDEGNILERKAEEELKTTQEKIELEYSSIEDFVKTPEKSFDSECKFNTNYQTQPLPKFSDMLKSTEAFNSTMRISSIWNLGINQEQSHKYSDCSIDNDNLSEG